MMARIYTEEHASVDKKLCTLLSFAKVKPDLLLDTLPKQRFCSMEKRSAATSTSLLPPTAWEQATILLWNEESAIHF
jgi:hypothetical protein